jgi:hypothetical protein
MIWFLNFWLAVWGKWWFFLQYKGALLAYAMLLCRKKYQVWHVFTFDTLIPTSSFWNWLTPSQWQLLTSRPLWSFAGVISCKHKRYMRAVYVWEIQGKGESQIADRYMVFVPMVWHEMWMKILKYLDLLVDWDADWPGYGDTSAAGAGDWASNRWRVKRDWSPMFGGIRDPEKPLGWLVGTSDRAR